MLGPRLMTVRHGEPGYVPSVTAAGSCVDQ